MPDLRALLVASGVGIGIALYLTLFWNWPLAVGGGIGIVLGGLALVGSVSIGPDPAEADAAWRAAAPEFSDPPAAPASSGSREAQEVADDDGAVSPERT
ncbi:MAG: hypothetical protein V4515_09060 [Chloroflexota bacterium]